MVVAETIEDQIDMIENSGLSVSDQYKKISELTDRWKFTTCYPSDATHPDYSDTVEIQFSDLDLQEGKNELKMLFRDIEKELSLEERNGFYNIKFKKHNRNFTPEAIHALKQEILSGIRGKIMVYHYIQQIQKIENATVQLHTNDWFYIKACNKKNILGSLRKNTPSNTNGKKQWFVMVLSAIQSQCSHFTFASSVFTTAYASGFDKIFLFDFYKGEVLELKTEPVYS